MAQAKVTKSRETETLRGSLLAKSREIESGLGSPRSDFDMAHDSDAAIGGRHKPKSRETKTGAGPPRAAAELFRAVGEAIGGAAPVDTLARELGVSKREMQRICNGQNEPWEALTQKLQALVSARIRALGALYAELRARNAG